MEIMQGKNRMHDAVKVVAALSGVAVGVNAFLNISTAAYWGSVQNASQQPFNNRIVIATSLVAGPGVANSLQQALGTTNPNLPAPRFTPIKALNAVSISGGVMLAADALVLRGLKLPGYNQWLRPFVISIGMGALIGGALGGLFDPPTNPGAIGNPAGRAAFPQARTPGFAGAAGLSGGSSSFGFNSGRAQ